MINSISIKNFKNLEDLKIPSLKRVNLITGKNNTGKSSLLEAVSLIIDEGNPSLIDIIINDRGEDYSKHISDYDLGNSYTKEKAKYSIQNLNLKSLSSLFYKRKIEFDTNEIEISSTGKNLSKLSLNLINYEEKKIFDKKGNPIGQKKVASKNIENNFALEIDFQGTEKHHNLIPLNEKPFGIYANTSNLKSIPLLSINNNSFFKIDTSLFFDSIALSEKENYVIEALQIIEPTIERLAFVENGKNNRKAVVKLKNEKEIVPLQSMGDGINRVLTIALLLVNAENGYLLIDEFENGLHYSVQEKLWKIIFHLSQKLNIQILATTHSNDCINSFENILNDSTNSYEGKLIRLDNVNGKIKQVEFDKEELKIATQQNIEVR
jgi:AAA15 family ATPase/GTPase